MCLKCLRIRSNFTTFRTNCRACWWIEHNLRNAIRTKQKSIFVLKCSYKPSKCTTFICFCKLYLFLKNPLHRSHWTRSGDPWSILMWYLRAKLSGNIFPHCSHTVWKDLLWARWTCKSSKCSTTFFGQFGHWTFICALFLCSSSKSGVLKLSLHYKYGF